MNRYDLAATQIVKDPIVKELKIKIKLSRSSNGLLHENHCGSIEGRSRFVFPKTVSVYGRNLKSTCSQCLYNAVYNRSPALGNLFRFEGFLLSLDEPHVSPSMLDLFHLREDLAYHHESICFLLKMSPNAFLPLRVRLLKARDFNLDTVQAKISRFKRSDAAKLKLKEEISAKLRESGKGDLSGAEEMVLIGSTLKNTGSHELLLPLEIYSIFETKELIVAYAPRYVFNYLSEVAQNFGDTLKVSAPYKICDSPDVSNEEYRYGAARLWDPYGGGPLANLNTAFETAKAL